MITDCMCHQFPQTEPPPRPPIPFSLHTNVICVTDCCRLILGGCLFIRYVHLVWRYMKAWYQNVYRSLWKIISAYKRRGYCWLMCKSSYGGGSGVMLLLLLLLVPAIWLKHVTTGWSAIRCNTLHWHTWIHFRSQSGGTPRRSKTHPNTQPLALLGATYILALKH